MSRLFLLLYIGLTLYIWINAVSEFAFGNGNVWNRMCHSVAKILFAPFWPLCIFSATGREYLFNWTKGANL